MSALPRVTNRDRRPHAIAAAADEWRILMQRWRLLHQGRAKSDRIRDMRVKYHDGDDLGYRRYIYEHSFFWFIHDVIFLEEDQWLLNSNHYALCCLLQDVRERMLALDLKSRDRRQALQKCGSHKYLVMATREFMKTGIIRCLPHWITTFRPKTTMRYARDTIDSAGNVLGRMKMYWADWPQFHEVWPWLRVTAEKRKQYELSWSKYSLSVPPADRFTLVKDAEDGPSRIEPIYGIRISNECTVEAFSPEKGFTGRRSELQIDDDVVGKDNAHTLAGRESVRKFRNESVNTLRTGGANILIGTIHHPKDEVARQLSIADSPDAKYDPIRPKKFYMPAYWDTQTDTGETERVYAYPEILDALELQKRLMDVGPREFAMQYLLQPISAEDVWYPYQRLMLWDPKIIDDPTYAGTEAFAILADPALSKKSAERKDQTAIVTLSRNMVGEVKTWRVQQGYWQQHEVEQRLYREWLHCRNMPIAASVDCYMENVAFIESYRQSVVENVRREFDADFDVLPLKTNTVTAGKRARMLGIEPLIHARKWFFRAKPGVNLVTVDRTDDDAMLDAIEDDQHVLYESIRDAHGFNDDGGLDSDHVLDAAARIRQVMDEDSGAPTFSVIPNADAGRDAQVRLMIQQALRRNAKQFNDEWSGSPAGRYDCLVA